MLSSNYGVLLMFLLYLFIEVNFEESFFELGKVTFWGYTYLYTFEL